MKKLMIALFAAAGLVGGCVVHAHGYPRHYRGDVVYVETGHVHTSSCGHYRCGGSWYYTHGHVHGHGCGHSYVSGVWVEVD